MTLSQQGQTIGHRAARRSGDQAVIYQGVSIRRDGGTFLASLPVLILPADIKYVQAAAESAE
jgi:hypothetical protein